MVSVTSSSDPDPGKAATGLRQLPDVGAHGFVARDGAAWIAGAALAEEAVRVSVSGTGASEEKAIALLKETLHRRTTGAESF